MLDLSRLSSEQRAAILAGDGPLLILAGPGSGKTTVLAARIAYLVAGRSVPPTSILALAFATKAARELRSRLVGLLGDDGRAVDVATFHAFGLRVIRAWSEELGLGPYPPIVFDGGDARAILHDLLDTADVPEDLRARSDLPRLVERYRLGDADVRSTSAPSIALLVGAYEAVLERRRAVDFAAMLALPLRLLDTRPDAARFLRDAYRHVLVDEFQDLCAAQYRLVRALAAGSRNLVVVGDPAQTVFTWRGADVRFVRAFLADFPEARVVGLHDNFRSSGRIVALATALGRPLPYARPLRATNPPGDPPELVVARDERGEAAFVAGEIARLHGAGQIDHPGEVAVLFRTNPQADELALALRERGLAYRVHGHADVLARAEVRAAVAYLRLAHDPSDVVALARVANVPPRGLGRIAEELRAHPVPLPELADRARSHGRRAVDGAETLAALIAELHACAKDLAPAALLDLALDRSGYREWLAGRKDGPRHLAHVETLRDMVSRSTDLAEVLTALQVDDADGGEGDARERVVLSTIHGAKGGEWRVVFVVGLEDGLLPHHRALSAEGNVAASVEDERRVAYVAVTRPRERLYLTRSVSRRVRDRSEPRRPSRFLRGLPLVERAA